MTARQLGYWFGVGVFWGSLAMLVVWAVSGVVMQGAPT